MIRSKIRSGLEFFGEAVPILKVTFVLALLGFGLSLIDDGQARKVDNSLKTWEESKSLTIQQLIKNKLAIPDPIDITIASKLIGSKISMLDPAIRDLIAKNILRAAEKYELPDTLIMAIIYAESHFNPLARSNKGAVGLMQILPSSHKALVKNHKAEELYHIAINIDIGCKIFKMYYDKDKVNRHKNLTQIENTFIRYLGGKDVNYMNKILTRFTQLEIEKRKLLLDTEKNS